MVEYQAKFQGLIVKTDMRTNAQALGQADANIFTMWIHNAKTKQLVKEVKVAAASKVVGKLRASFKILCEWFSPEKRWLELVNETK